MKLQAKNLKEDIFLQWLAAIDIANSMIEEPARDILISVLIAFPAMDKLYDDKLMVEVLKLLKCDWENSKIADYEVKDEPLRLKIVHEFIKYGEKHNLGDDDDQTN